MKNTASTPPDLRKTWLRHGISKIQAATASRLLAIRVRWMFCHVDVLLLLLLLLFVRFPMSSPAHVNVVMSYYRSPIVSGLLRCSISVGRHMAVFCANPTIDVVI